MPDLTTSDTKIEGSSKIVAAMATLLGALTVASPVRAEMTFSPSGFGQAAERHGACVVKNEYSAAREYVLDTAAARPPRIRELFARFQATPCGQVAASMKFSDGGYRYPLAIALVNRDQLLLRSDFAGVEPLEHLDFNQSGGSMSRLEQLSPADRDVVRFSKFGECVVRHSFDWSKYLVLTKAASGKEKKAFEALAPAMASCRDSGQELRFSSFNFKGLIAINIYRLASVDQRPSASLTPRTAEGFPRA